MTATIDLLRRHTELLLASITGLDDAALGHPSHCAGWSRGHVLTHIARNADALSRVVDAVVDGAEVTMYTSDRARDAEIDDGATRGLETQVRDVRESATALEARLHQLLPEHSARTVPRTPGSQRQVAGGDVVLLRLNEVVLHHIDLDTGFGFDDLDDPTLEVLLRLAGARRSEDRDRHEAFVLDDGTRVRGEAAAVLAFATRQRTDDVIVDGAMIDREERP